MARHCLSRSHPDRRTNYRMSSATVGMPHINSVKIFGTADLVPSSHPGKTIQKSPVQNGHTDTGIWSKICGQGLRNGGLSRPAAASFFSVILIAATADYIKA